MKQLNRINRKVY